jgi:hypothetical protein
MLPMRRLTCPLLALAPGFGTAFQWLKNGTNISGATSSVYQIPNAQPADAGGYLAVVSNAKGSATSDAAVLTLSILPAPILAIESVLLVSWTNMPGYVLQGSPGLAPPHIGPRYQMGAPTWEAGSRWPFLSCRTISFSAFSNNHNHQPAHNVQNNYEYN